MSEKPADEENVSDGVMDCKEMAGEELTEG